MILKTQSEGKNDFKKRKTRIAFLTNIPVPYREELHKHLDAVYRNNYSVIYSKKIEPNRQWKFDFKRYNKFFLKGGTTFKFKKSYIHFNLSIVRLLNELNPDVIILTGFYFTMLFAFIWALIKKRQVIVFIDGTIKSEEDLTFFHRLVRKIVFKYANCFVGPSDATLDLYHSYGIQGGKLFKSRLYVNNQEYSKGSDKKYDLMFCGQLIERKNPIFFLEVVKALKATRGYVTGVIVGDGQERSKIESYISKNKLDIEIIGFVQPSEIHKYYSLSKLFLFPTMDDPWGVVANEACASGLPVLTTKFAGCANELVVHGKNGYIVPLEKNIWKDKIIELLENSGLYESMSNRSLEIVKEFNLGTAAGGLIGAIDYCAKT